MLRPERWRWPLRGTRRAFIGWAELGTPRAFIEWALVFAVAIAPHARSVTFGFVGLDDEDLIVSDSAFLGRPSSLWRIFTRAYMHVVDTQHAYYRPLVTASYILDAGWNGATPAMYHLTNVLLHASVSLLFFDLLRRFAMGRAAVLGALAFAVHPALGPAVAWIPGRNDTLLTFCVLAAWRLLPGESTDAGERRTLAHLAFFALALLTKETAFAAPAVWGLHVALSPEAQPKRPPTDDDEALEPASARPRERARARRRRWITLVAGWASVVGARLALSSAASSALGFFRAPGRIDPQLPALALKSLGALVFPANPSLLSDAQDMPLWTGIAALALFAGATLVPGVRPRVVAMGGAAFFFFLLPALLTGTTLALSTRLYLPACGVLLAATEIVRALIERADRDAGGITYSVSFALCAVTVVAFALLTVGVTGSFKDARSFARAEVDAAPHSAMAHLCLGIASWRNEHVVADALAQYNLALDLGAVEVVHNDIAVVFMELGGWAEAERELRAEIRDNPRFALAYRNLALVLAKEARPEEASAAQARADALENESP